MLVIKNHNDHFFFPLDLRKRSFLPSVNDGDDGKGIGKQMEDKINEITQLVKEKRFQKKGEKVLKLLNVLSTMAKEDEKPN